MPNRDSIKLQSNFIEITLRHGCFPVNLMHILRAPLYKNTYGIMEGCFSRLPLPFFRCCKYGFFKPKPKEFQFYYSMILNGAAVGLRLS